jgi:hypothetical protein
MKEEAEGAFSVGKKVWKESRSADGERMKF